MHTILNTVNNKHDMLCVFVYACCMTFTHISHENRVSLFILNLISRAVKQNPSLSLLH